MPSLIKRRPRTTPATWGLPLARTCPGYFLSRRALALRSCRTILHCTPHFHESPHPPLPRPTLPEPLLLHAGQQTYPGSRSFDPVRSSHRQRCGRDLDAGHRRRGSFPRPRPEDDHERRAREIIRGLRFKPNRKGPDAPRRAAFRRASVASWAEAAPQIFPPTPPPTHWSVPPVTRPSPARGLPRRIKTGKNPGDRGPSLRLCIRVKE